MPSPVAIPGCCGLCGGHAGPVIDTGVTHIDVGVLYICATCVTAMSDVFENVGANTHKTRQAEYHRGYADGFGQAMARARVALTGVEATHEVRMRARELNNPEISKVTNDGSNDTGFITSFGADANPVVDITVSEPAVVPTDAGSDAEDIPEPESSSVEISDAPVVEGRDDLSGDSDDGAVDESNSSGGAERGSGQLDFDF